jgi:hypothetical protein
VASPFLVSFWNSPAVAWAASSFVLSQNMSHSDNTLTDAAAATSQVKLCPYDEEEPPSGSVSSRSSSPRRASNANALASLSKQDIETF